MASLGLGLLMLFFALKWYRTIIKAKDVVLFPLINLKSSFTIKSPGLYVICVFVKGKISFSKSMEAKIVPDGAAAPIPLNRLIINQTIWRHGIRGAQYGHFIVDKPGEYYIEIGAPDAIETKFSPLILKSLLEGEIGIHRDVEVLIMEGIPNYQRFLIPIFAVMGSILIISGLLDHL